MPINYDFIDPGAVQDTSRNRLQSIFDQGTRMRAGRAQAGGDYGGAADTLARGGLTEDAQKTRAYGQGIADDAASREGLTSYAAGDYARARGAFARGGSLAGVQAADTGAKASREEALKVTLKLADAIGADVEAGHDPAAAFDKAAPLFAKLYPDAAKDIPQYRDAFIKDPQGAIAAIKAATAKELEPFTLAGPDGRQTRYGADGQPVATAPGGLKPDWKERKKADGSTEWFDINNPSAAAQPTPPAAAPTGGVYDQVASVAAQAGAQPAETAYLQRLAQVESNGNASARNGRSTGVFQFHPDTFARVGGRNINDVGEQTEAALTLSRLDRQMLQGLGVEPTDANVYIMHQQGAAGGRALLTAPPEINAVAALAPVYGSEKTARKAIVNNGGSPDMTAGDFVNYWRQRWGGQGATAPQATPAEPGARVVAGDEPIGATADPNVVKMLLEGRYPVPTGRAAVDPKYYAALQAAAAQDPSFDAANYPTRVKTRASFTSGKDAANITALNTVVGHLDALDQSIDKLGNLQGFPGSQFNNKAARVLAEASGTDPRFKDFDAKKIAVANELTRVFRGTGGAEADIQGYLKQLDSAASPAALHQAVRSIAELINSRLEAVADTYAQGMGLTKDPMEFLHPTQAKAFARLSGRGPAPTDQAIKLRTYNPKTGKLE